jgi:4-hydroxy-3-polyprenylbenzoate decarboxylase
MTVAGRLVVAITGASGVVYGIRALGLLREQAPHVESHLVLSRGARLTLAHETGTTVTAVKALADVVYNEHDLGAALSSGSFQTMGMLVLPCSIKTLSGIANCFSDNLVTRAADVTLKERRRLVLVVRETPLHAGHLRLMTHATEAGAVIMPPVPAFYNRPSSLDEVVDQTVGRCLDLFGINTRVVRRWSGEPPPGRGSPAGQCDGDNPRDQLAT